MKKAVDISSGARRSEAGEGALRSGDRNGEGAASVHYTSRGVNIASTLT